MSIHDEVLAIVEREAGSSFEPSASLEELGLDSLETLSLFTALDIPDAAIPQIQSVADIIRYVEARS